MSSQNLNQERQWQEAYVAQERDAAMGRLLQGTLHNLNGAVQGISMQYELLAMMLAKAQNGLNDLPSTDKAQNTAAVEIVQSALEKQESLLDKVDEKVQLCFSVLKQAGQHLIVPGTEVKLQTINALIESEIVFLCSDPFFKHKVTRKICLCEESPSLENVCREIRLVVFILLENALLALQEKNEKDTTELHVETRCTEGALVLRVADNGVGIPDNMREQIFEPFFTTRQGHAGLGLYLASKIVRDCGGTLKIMDGSDFTCFQVTLPVG